MTFVFHDDFYILAIFVMITIAAYLHRILPQSNPFPPSRAPCIPHQSHIYFSAPLVGVGRVKLMQESYRELVVQDVTSLQAIRTKLLA